MVTHRFGSLEDLARALNVEIVGSSCAVRACGTEGSVVIQGVQARRLEFDRFDVEDSLTFRNCELDELDLSQCSPSSVSILNCKIGRLSVRRELGITGINVTGGRFGELSILDAAQVSIAGTRVDNAVTIKALGGDVKIVDTIAESVVIDGQVSTGSQRPALTFENLGLGQALQVSGISASALTIRRCEVGRLLLRRVAVRTAVLVEGLRCHGVATLDRVAAAMPVELCRSTYEAGLEASAIKARAGSDAVVMTLSECTVKEFLRVTRAAEPAGVESSVSVVLHSSTIEGQLKLPENAPAYTLTGRTKLADLDIPTGSLRSRAAMKQFISSTFRDCDAAAYAAVRPVLASRQRLAEEDICYYLQREAEMAADPIRIRRVIRSWFLGGLLGWGVRIWPPIRALIVAIVATGLVLSFVPGPDERKLGLLDGLVLASALWLNVGTGTPQLLTSPGWTVAATASTILGLVLLAVIVGITIRRLIR